MITLHFVLFAAGFTLAYAIVSLLDVSSVVSRKAAYLHLTFNKINFGKRLSLLTIGVAVCLIAFWHIPVEFDAAMINAALGMEMQLGLLFAGGLVFAGTRFLSRNVKIIAPVAMGKALGLYGVLLLLAPAQIYAIYPAYQQQSAGVLLLMLMLFLDFTIMPLWLYTYFGRSSLKRDQSI